MLTRTKFGKSGPSAGQTTTSLDRETGEVDSRPVLVQRNAAQLKIFRRGRANSVSRKCGLIYSGDPDSFHAPFRRMPRADWQQELAE
jgi:hypothetical protein